jgi:hypothetical protein
MLAIVIRAGLVATALVLSGAAAGCLGDDGEADESADGAPMAASGVFAELERRPLELPNVQVPTSATAAGRKFPRHADDCWSQGAPEPGAIVLPAIGGPCSVPTREKRSWSGDRSTPPCFGVLPGSCSSPRSGWSERLAHGR